MSRAVLLWSSAFGQAIRRDLQFRAQAVATVVAGLVQLGLSIIPVLVLAGVAGAASGWSPPLAVAVSGAYGIVAALLDCFVAPNCARMDAYVRHGELDLILLRPVRAGWSAAVRWIAPAELVGIMPSLGLVIAGLAVAGVHPDLVGIAGALGWMLVGGTAFALLWLNFSYLAFWMDGAEPVHGFVLQLRAAGEYPRRYFPGPARIVFATVIPALLLGSLPVEALLGAALGPALAIAAGCVVLAGLLTAAHWTIAVRRYAGAST